MYQEYKTVAAAFALAMVGLILPSDGLCGTPFGMFYKGGPGNPQSCEQNHMVATGTGAVRVDLRWSTVEPCDGDFVTGGRSFNIMEIADDNELAIQLILRIGSAEWSTHHPDTPGVYSDCCDSDGDGFSGNCFSKLSNRPLVQNSTWPTGNGDGGWYPEYWDFVYNTISYIHNTLAYDLQYIVIENEVAARDGVSWSGDMTEYRKVLETAAHAIHKVDPNLKVADSGLASEVWAAMAVYWLGNVEDETEGFPDFPEGFPAQTGDDVYEWFVDYFEGSDNECFPIGSWGSWTAVKADILADDRADEGWEYMEQVDTAFEGGRATIDAFNLHLYDNFECYDESENEWGACTKHLLALFDGFFTTSPIYISNEFGRNRLTSGGTTGIPTGDDNGEPMAISTLKHLITGYGHGLDYIGWFKLDTCRDCPDYCKLPLTDIEHCYTIEDPCTSEEPELDYTDCEDMDSTPDWPWPEAIITREAYYAYADFVETMGDDLVPYDQGHLNSMISSYAFRDAADDARTEVIYYFNRSPFTQSHLVPAPQDDQGIYPLYFRHFDYLGQITGTYSILTNPGTGAKEAWVTPYQDPVRLEWIFPGCPYLSSMDGSWVRQNSVLRSVPSGVAGMDASDRVDRLIVPATVTESGTVELRLEEFEREESFVDQISASILLGDRASTAWVPSRGIVEVEETVRPTSIRWVDGGVTPELPVLGDVGKVLNVVFENTGGPTVDILGLDGSGKPNQGGRAALEDGIEIQARTQETDEWVSLGLFQPRQLKDTSHFVLAPAYSNVDRLELRLRWRGAHELHGLFLASSGAAAELDPIDLVDATHSENGSVLSLLRSADGDHVRLGPGESIELRGTVDLPVGTELSVVVDLEGHYHGEEETTGLEAETPGISVRTLPNPFRHETSIALDLGREELAEVSIYTVSGRRVRAYSGVSTPSLDWNGTDESGREVPPGIYYVKVRTPNEEAVLRTVKLQ